MRKIYSLLAIAIVSLCSFVASAASITLNVNGNPGAVTATVSGQTIDLVEGENTISGDDYNSVYIVAEDGYYLTLVNDTYGYSYGEGSSVSCYIYDGLSFTLNIKEIVYDCTAKITVDNASKVAVRAANTYRQIALEDGENEVSLSSEIEGYLMISSSSSTPIYSVTQNGEAVSPYYSSYCVYPSSTGVDEIVITAEYPDVKVPVNFSFLNGDEAGDYNCLSSVTVDGVAVDLASLEGLEVQVGSSLVVRPNTTDYNFSTFSVNGNSQYVYNGYSYSTTVTEELSFVIDAHKYGQRTFAIDVEDASTVTVYQGSSYQGVTIALENGYNELSVSEQTSYIQVVATTGNIIYSIVDENNTDYTSSYSITLHDNMVLTIKAGEIVRDQVLTVNVHDLDQAPASFGFYSDLYSSRTKVELVEGENTINFYSGENPFGVQGFDATTASIYVDGAPKNASYGSTSFSASNGTVVDLFFDKTKDGSKAVAFEFGEGVQYYWVSVYAGNENNYMSNWSEGLNVLEGCKLYIEASTYYFANPSIKVDGVELEANESGVYEFTVTDDCKVSIEVKGDETSVNAISIDNVNNDVYNLQGISVLRNASAEQVSTLPAGIYVINGKKVVKK